MLLTALVLALSSVALTSAATTCKSKYDFIVVGAGTGGGVTAARLARYGHKVLLIDAGSDYYSTNQSVPIFHGFSTEDPNIAWDFRVKHYPASTGLRQNVLYPRSSGIGGCSIHNALISMYPFKGDYDYIASITKDSSWADTKMREYFKRLEDNDMALTVANSHGNNGWLGITQVDLRNLVVPFDLQLLGAVAPVILDLPLTPYNDVNGVGSMSAEGWHLQPLGIKNGKRSGVYSFVTETKALYPNNLDILTDTLVTKILLDDNNNAYGVQIATGKNLYRASKNPSKVSTLTLSEVYANREVILSGGTYNTPQLLMLSGIGNSTKLKALNITPRVNLPGVGLNLQDRYEVSVNYQMKNEWASVKKCAFLPDAAKDSCYKDYVDDYTTIYGGNGVVLGANTKSSVVASGEDPDVYMFMFPTNFTGYHVGFSDAFRGARDQLSILALKGRSKNTLGEVNLVSTDPRDMPDINFNYFAQGGSDDIKAVISGIKRARSWAKNILFSIFIEKETLPGKSVDTDAELEDYIRKNAWGHHACCTAKIGNSTDQYAVLDAELKVRGVGNLRVVDASAFAKIPGFFINVPIMMMAEKAADMISSAANATGAVCV